MPALRIITKLQDATDIVGVAGTGKGWIRDANGAMEWTDLATQAELDAADRTPGLVAPAHPLLARAFNTVDAGAAGASRVTIAKTGTLRDFAVFVGVAGGNIEAAVYSAASPRARLWTSGVIACPAAGSWQIVGDPGLAVVAGTQLDLVVWESAFATFASFDAPSGGMGQLPAGFWPGAGALPKLAWFHYTAGPLPATIAEAALTAWQRVFMWIARVA